MAPLVHVCITPCTVSTHTYILVLLPYTMAQISYCMAARAVPIFAVCHSQPYNNLYIKWSVTLLICMHARSGEASWDTMRHHEIILDTTVNIMSHHNETLWDSTRRHETPWYIKRHCETSWDTKRHYKTSWDIMRYRKTPSCIMGHY